MRPPKRRSFQSEKRATKSILCIPGNWKNPTDVITSIAKSSNGEYIAAGSVLMHVEDKFSFQLDICERDERMKDSFAWAGQVTQISEATVKAVGNHSTVVYLIGETGSFARAEAIAHAAGAILKSGGLGIKIETAGKAFDTNKWLDKLEHFTPSDLYDMFVIDSLVQDDGTTFSCGMHNLGLKDTIISDEDFQQAVDLIRIFSFYQIIDKPTINNKDTFRETHEAPSYLVLNEFDYPYNEHELFRNPFGVWRLKRK